ncbi:MAG TPA: hypothetical protein VIG90_05695 [Pedomonas sp.]|uniref:hypothetical protein n=1 Tax=Pedomonas sp. TaxID=2976421 RepID=UPI002F412274
MIIGNYVKTFSEADMGMLEGASLNAPYKFHWVYLEAIDGKHIVCNGGGEKMRLPFRNVQGRDWAEVVVQDPIFGPVKFKVAPFLRRDGAPVGHAAAGGE